MTMLIYGKSGQTSHFKARLNYSILQFPCGTVVWVFFPGKGCQVIYHSVLRNYSDVDLLLNLSLSVFPFPLSFRPN